MSNLPNDPVPTVPATSGANGDLPSAAFPTLPRIQPLDPVGPEITNLQPAALEKRTETLRVALNNVIALVNAIDTTFLRRLGDAPKDGLAGLRADMPANGHTLTGMRAGGAVGEALAYEQLSAETNRAQDAEALLQSHINTEASTRSSADLTLQSNINGEASARSSADSTLQTNINNEISRAIGQENLKANLNNPILTGTPQAPTPTLHDNSTKIATTAFVVSEIANSVPPLSTTSVETLVDVSLYDGGPAVTISPWWRKGWSNQLHTVQTVGTYPPATLTASGYTGISPVDGVVINSTLIGAGDTADCGVIVDMWPTYDGSNVPSSVRVLWYALGDLGTDTTPTGGTGYGKARLGISAGTYGYFDISLDGSQNYILGDRESALSAVGGYTTQRITIQFSSTHGVYSSYLFGMRGYIKMKSQIAILG